MRRVGRNPRYKSQQRILARLRYWRKRAAGSCQNCGAEAVKGRSRCTPCGQRQAQDAARRASE